MEKKKRQLVEAIEEQKLIIGELDKELIELDMALEEAKANLREQMKQKELDLAQVKEEERLKKIAESNLKNKRISRHQEVEKKKHGLRKELKTVEDELSNLRMSRGNGFEMEPSRALYFRAV